MTHTLEATGSRRPQFDTLAERLWWARETTPLTQAALAMRLGISKRTVQNYEAGTKHPLEDRARLWANACNVDFGWLAGDFYSRPDGRAQAGGRVAAQATRCEECAIRDSNPEPADSWSVAACAEHLTRYPDALAA